MSKTKGFSPPQSLVDYFERIGAEILHFRRGMVKLYIGKYYIEKSIISVDKDGVISFDDPKHAPTEEEVRKIAEDFKNTEFPFSCECSENAALDLVETLERSIPGSKAFVFYNRASGNVVMVQHRYDDRNGNRQFVPHTWWSDHEWRKMEPERKLPLWKPKVSRSSKIMIHEGAKAAKAAEKIANDPYSKHPWREKLAEHEHWGMIGGAMAPHRTEYSEVNMEKPTEVIYVCDNDRPGEEAINLISRFYGRSLKAVKFDPRWAKSWDMADDMPTGLFDPETGYYTGPRLEELYHPVTWATKITQTGARGRPTIDVTNEFAQEWFHSVIPEVYVHRDFPHQQYSRDEFNVLIKPFSDAKDTADKLQKHWASKAVHLTYDPTAPAGVFHDDSLGRLSLNTYAKSRIIPVPYKNAKEIRPWLDFLKHLVPDERDRHNLKRWIATLVSRPDIRMLFGVLMISENQGVGKDTLGDKILAELVGIHNCSFPNESNIVDSTFNDWVGSKRLAVVHEIYAGHSSKAYDRLKSYITDKNIDINKKYQNSYRVTNWTLMYVMSNSMQALKLSSGDRRWFVPRVTEKINPPSADRNRPKQWWSEFYDWLNKKGGLGMIRYWCDLQMQYGGVGYFGREEEAPPSSAKDELIKEGYSAGMRFIFEALTDIKEYANDRNIIVAVTDKDAQRAINTHIYNGQTSKYLEKPATIRRVAKDVGWFIHDEQLFGSWGEEKCRGHRAMIIGPGSALLQSVPFQTLKQGINERISDVLKWIEDHKEI